MPTVGPGVELVAADSRRLVCCLNSEGSPHVLNGGIGLRRGHEGTREKLRHQGREMLADARPQLRHDHGVGWLEHFFRTLYNGDIILCPPKVDGESHVCKHAVGV